MPRYVPTQAMPSKSVHAGRTAHTTDVDNRENQRHSHQPPRRRHQSNYDWKRKAQPQAHNPLQNYHGPTVAAWAFCLVTVLWRSFIKPFNTPDRVDDFSNLHRALVNFVHHRPVYIEDLSTTDPHYLYSPGATVLLSPVGWISSNVETSRLWFILANSIAIIAGIALLFHIAGRTLGGFLFPATVTVAYFTENVTNTLTFSNINGICFLLLTVVINGLIKGRTVHTGLALGFVGLIKPFFFVLLLLVAMQRMWKSLGIAVAVPIVFNILGYILVKDADVYRTTLMPYIRTPRDFANLSIVGVGLAQHWPSLVVFFLRAIVVIVALLAVFLAWTYYAAEPQVFVPTASTALLLAAILAGSLGQQYYTLFFIPVIATIKHWGWADGVVLGAGFASILPMNPSITSPRHVVRVILFSWTMLSWVVLLIGTVLIGGKHYWSTASGHDGSRGARHREQSSMRAAYRSRNNRYGTAHRGGPNNGWTTRNHGNSRTLPTRQGGAGPKSL